MNEKRIDAVWSEIVLNWYWQSMGKHCIRTHAHPFQMHSIAILWIPTSDTVQLYTELCTVHPFMYRPFHTKSENLCAHSFRFWRNLSGLMILARNSTKRNFHKEDHFRNLSSFSHVQMKILFTEHLGEIS